MNTSNMKKCPDCDAFISKRSLRCRLCNYELMKSKSNIGSKKQIKGKCVDCSCDIGHKATRCNPCANKIIENANKTISNSCIDCKAVIGNSANRCVNWHLINSRKVERPTYAQLLIDKQTLSMSNIGKKYGVSDNAVRKWLKKYTHSSLQDIDAI
jgi:hypothetical protein